MSGDVVHGWVDFKFGMSVASEARGFHGRRAGVFVHAHMQVVVAGSTPS